MPLAQFGLLLARLSSPITAQYVALTPAIIQSEKEKHPCQDKPREVIGADNSQNWASASEGWISQMPRKRRLLAEPVIVGQRRPQVPKKCLLLFRCPSRALPCVRHCAGRGRPVT